MPDPLTAATITKAIEAVGAERSKEEAQAAATGLIMRMLGPAADEIGEALRRFTEYRLRNVGRVIFKAADKSGGADSGIVNPRVAQVLLEEGSYCDDELMAEYLGGALAASRTPNGRDDRAVTWSGLVASLSSLQVRAHFLIYREWAARLHGVPDFNLGLGTVRERATTDFELDEFAAALVHDSDVAPADAIAHSILGLVRVGLLDDLYGMGSRNSIAGFGPESHFESLLRVRPSVVGLELYGWAQGLPGLSPIDFLSKAVVFGDQLVPRLEKVELVFISAAEAPPASPQP
jgi:hypothetical protein